MKRMEPEFWIALAILLSTFMLGRVSTVLWSLPEWVK